MTSAPATWPRPALILMDHLVPLAQIFRAQSGVPDRDIWKRLIWHALPLSFFAFWLAGFIPVIGGFAYTLGLIPLAIWLHFQVHSISGLRRKAEIALSYYTVILIGFGGVRSFVGHFFMADFIARNIGWETGSPFQTELAFFTLGSAVAGLMSLWIRDHLVTGIVITKAIFWYGAAYVHIQDIIQEGNFAPYNAGAPLVGDIIYPTLMLWLLWTARGPGNERDN